MPITLTTPANPGDNAPGKLYPLAKILDIRISMKRKRIALTVGFGNIVDGEWVDGNGLSFKSYEIVGEDYDTVVANPSLGGELVYAGVRRLLYAWLQEHEPRFAGTVE
jgi:hypothetical protein